ncbi:MAG: DUF3526 domain-containing protein [Balneolaceae bacterium]
MSLITYEWKLLRSGYGFTIAIVFFAIIGIYGIWTGVSWSQFQKQAIDTAHEVETKTFLDLRQTAEQQEEGTALDPVDISYAVNPGMIGLFYSRPAYMPPTLLAATSIGQSDVYPYLFDVTAHRKDAFLHQEEMDNPVNLLLGRFDLAFVIVYLMPLLIIGLTFNVISGERERNTWKLLLSQPFSIYRLLGIKLLLRGLSVMCVIIPLFMAVVGMQDANVPLAMVGIWILSIFTYLFFWLLLSLVVNTYNNSSSSSNALVLVCIWIILVLVIPASIHLVADSLHPVPSRSHLIEETRQIETEVRVDPAGLLEDWYRENPGKRPEDFDPNRYNFPLFWMAIQREVDRLMEPVVDEYDRALNSQYRFVNAARILSPAVLMQDVLNELAGSGYSRYQHFMAQVENFHHEHINYFAPRTYAHEQLQVSDYSNLPRFEYEAEPTRLPVLRAITASSGILAWFLILLFSGMFTIRRLHSIE